MITTGRNRLFACAGGAGALFALPAQAPAADTWVTFASGTDTRLVADPDVGVDDPAEKDFATGDVDNDGDVDLVVVRKQPFTSTGRRTNVLLMNEDGVLVDRTLEYASASDVAGDEGFLTPTNDRDVVLTDVDGDGWLDAVTSVTLSDDLPKHISHPRVYMNLGEDDGAWLGFRYEDARFPLLHPTAGPRFCSVDAADVTGDGAPDLFFADYDSGGAQIFDFDNRLLVNDGTGHFYDDTDERLTPEIREAAFGMSSVFADMNGDGLQDIVKLTTLSAPLHIGIAYNEEATQGYFQIFEEVYNLAPYHLAVHDMNGDGMLDIVVSDHGTDRILVNTGNDQANRADFISAVIPETDNMGGNIGIGDLDRDGRPDLVLTDVEVDIPGCNRITYIKQNLSTVDQITFQEEEVIPAGNLTGLHDVAIFDIDGNGWDDLVFGRCSGLEIWMNEPSYGIEFGYPNGVPDILPPGTPHDLLVTLEPIGDIEILEGSAQLLSAIGDGPFEAVTMKPAGGSTYTAALPAGPCPGDVRFVVAAELTDGTLRFDPPEGTDAPRVVMIASSTTVALEDDMEKPGGWTVASDPSLTSGAWEQALPNATIYNGFLAAPAQDATPGAGTMCFVTENGAPGGAAGANDVDGGPAHLISPPIALGGAEARIGFAAWLTTFNAIPDVMTVALSGDDGATWHDVDAIVIDSTGSVWESHTFMVGATIDPPDVLFVRFTVADTPNDSITEAGIDDFTVELLVCDDACPADLDGNGAVDVSDLVALITAWGPCPQPCSADVDGSGMVDVVDLVALLTAWGVC